MLAPLSAPPLRFDRHVGAGDRRALLVLACLTPAARVSAEVAPTGCTKTLGGTLRGEDGRYLSAFVGAVFYDSSRRPIAAATCSNPKPGYDGTNSVNENGTCCYLLGPDGASQW